MIQFFGLKIGDCCDFGIIAVNCRLIEEKYPNIDI
jgi:hypothetical protein